MNALPSFLLATALTLAATEALLAQRVIPLHGASADTAFAREVEPGPLQYLNASGVPEGFLYYFPAAPLVKTDNPTGSATADTPAAPAVLLCPGGGYYVLAYEKEGIEVARRLAANGIATAVLMSRLPGTEPETAYPKLVALEDGRAALALMRDSAAALAIDPDRLAVMGFSAGGHLAILLSTLADAAERPAASALVYPVVSMSAPWSHGASVGALLGPSPSDSLRRAYSGELRVNSLTPPTFLVHAADDDGVPVRNSLAYAEALDAHGVPFELHVLPKGGHGFGMYAPGASVDWVSALIAWVRGGYGR